MKRTFGLLALLCATASHQASAVEQPKCGLPISIRSGLYFGQGYVEKQKTTAVGSALRKGSVVFYVSIADAQKYYSTAVPISITDPSPLSPNRKLEPGKKYPVRGTLALDNANHDSFELIDITTNAFTKALLPVRTGGWVCSDLIGKGFDGQTASIGMPTAEQDEPLVADIEEIAGGRTRAVSIVVSELDEATATLEVTYSVGGTVTSRSRLITDLYAGKVALGALSIELQKAGNQVKVMAVREPTDYGDWLRRQGLR